MAMKCMQTEDCWCRECTDRAIDPDTGADIRQKEIKNQSKQRRGPIDVAWIFENGLEQKLSAAIRCF